MEKIKVNKQEILTIIKENRKRHKKEFTESIKAYRVKVADLMAKELQKVVSGEKFETYFNVSKPTSHEKDYDLIIKMLEMSVDDFIEIDPNEFNQFVNDDWNWKSSFRATHFSNSTYFGMTSISGTSGSAGTTGISGTSGYSYDINFSEDEIEGTDNEEDENF